MAFHRFHRAEEREFQEEQEIASWGVWYLTTGHDENVSGTGVGVGRCGRGGADEILQLTWQIGHNTVVRGQFASNGALNNTKEEDYRPVKERW